MLVLLYKFFFTIYQRIFEIIGFESFLYDTNTNLLVSSWQLKSPCNMSLSKFIQSFHGYFFFNSLLCDGIRFKWYAMRLHCNAVRFVCYAMKN